MHQRFCVFIEGFPCPDNEFGLYGDPEDCSVYTQCFNGVSTRLSCPEGFHYSLKGGECLPIDSAGCALNGKR